MIKRLYYKKIHRGKENNKINRVLHTNTRQWANSTHSKRKQCYSAATWYTASMCYPTVSSVTGTHYFKSSLTNVVYY